MGCVISTCVLWLFYRAFDDFGQTGTAYPAPYALVYRNMSVLGVEGFSALPNNCLMLCYIFFTVAVIVNGVRDMCVGSLILFIWRKLNKPKADAYSSAVASGLICGEGIWTLPSSILNSPSLVPSSSVTCKCLPKASFS